MSNARVLPFFRRSWRPSDWSPQEIAEFYRVESALVQSGLSVTTDRGISDEGDPWFVFCREDNDEVIAHFARIDSEYVVASSFQRGSVRGRNFRALIRDLMDLHPLMMPVKRQAGQKVFLHPSALLLALLASAYFHSNEILGEHASTGHESRGGSLLSLLSEKIAIVAAMALAATWLEHQASSALTFLDGLPLFHGSADDQTAHVSTASHETQVDYLSEFFHIGFGAHQSALSQHANDPLAAQEADNAQAHQLPVPSLNSAPMQGNGPTIDATTAAASVGSMADSSQVGGSTLGVDSGSVGDQMGPATKNFAPIVLVEHQPDVSAGLVHTGDDQPSGAVNFVVAPNTDALQIALLETGNSAAQPIVLTTSPETVDAALQQALQQVGIDPNLLHDGASTGGSTASGSTQEAAVAGNASGGAASGQATSSQATSSQAAASQATSNSAPAPPALSDGQVEHIVANFLASTPNYEMTVSGAHVVILDTNASDMNSGHFSVETFSMSDGSTLSIVGIIQHPLALSA